MCRLARHVLYNFEPDTYRLETTRHACVPTGVDPDPTCVPTTRACGPGLTTKLVANKKLIADNKTSNAQARKGSTKCHPQGPPCWASVACTSPCSLFAHTPEWGPNGGVPPDTLHSCACRQKLSSFTCNNENKLQSHIAGGCCTPASG